MKICSIFVIFLFPVFSILQAQSWIRINQLGYLPESEKNAVFISKENKEITEFHLVRALNNQVVFTGKALKAKGSTWGMKSAYRFNFAGFQNTGAFYIKAGDTKSPSFRISEDVYRGTADFILQYMRQQRCGFNPFYKDSCHIHDGFIVDHPSRTGEIIDVKGGWHDASDYLQYVTTSANAVYQMLFAYTQNPEVWGDYHQASGLEGPNSIPDILDEIKWGLDWLLKMNPDSVTMFNQIADDRDHKGFRFPTKDSVSYGNGLYRPVYFITGKPQGLGPFKNRATGISSTAGKYSSVFALSARVFGKTDPVFAKKLQKKALEAFNFGLSDLGVAQTACTVSPYFYEEDNYTDDLELAALELYQLTGDQKYLKQAKYWGALEPVTPWMEKDTARHYQYYPFINLGHAQLASGGSEYTKEFTAYLKKGLQSLKNRGIDDPFRVRIPFIWCSNNLVVAAVTQARIYFQATSDSSFMELEASLRDWLFGCNPWGTSMICGLPAGGDSPLFPHAALTVFLNQTTFGGLVDGPVYATIYNNLRGIHLLKEDSYKEFQDGLAVYHDDIGDYSTNEPTMDGTASLSFYLSFLEKEGIGQKKQKSIATIDKYGALVRKNTEKKTICLLFSADEHADGMEHVLSTLSKKKVKASFFLTGKFLRNPDFSKYIKRMVAEKHYIGPHSDRHLLYAPWEKRDSLLIDRETFEKDLEQNYRELSGFEIKAEPGGAFLAPFEWYNADIASWTANLGFQLINFTPGIGTQADYTTPDMKNYKSSQSLMEGLIKFEKQDNSGLNGALILIHPGTHPDRTDKFYLRLGELIDYLKKKGYAFEKI